METVRREITPDPNSDVASLAAVSTTVPTKSPLVSGSGSLAFSRLLPLSSVMMKLCSPAVIDRCAESYVKS